MTKEKFAKAEYLKKEIEYHQELIEGFDGEIERTIFRCGKQIHLKYEAYMLTLSLKADEHPTAYNQLDISKDNHKRLFTAIRNTILSEKEKLEKEFEQL